MNLNTFSEHANALLNEDSRKRLEGTLKDLAKISHGLAGQSRTIREGIQTATEAMDNLAIVTSDMRQELPELLAHIRRSAQAVNQLTEELRHTGKTVQTMVEDSRPEFQRFTRETLGETALLVDELRRLTATLQRTVEQIEREPESLTFGRSALPRGPGE